jgi:uncharacterized protein YjdB
MWRRLVCVCVSLGAAACDGSGPSGPPVPATVEIVAATDTLRFLGATLPLAAVARDASGTPLAGTSIQWIALDPGVVGVDGSGTATALSAGAGRVVARAGSAQGTITLQVVQVPAELTVSPAADTLAFLGDTTRLVAVVRDAGGSLAPGASVTWISSDGRVVAVSGAGVATAVGAGSASVRATAGALQREVQILVRQVPTAVVVSPSTFDLVSIGQVVQLSGVARDRGGATIPGTTVRWRSTAAAVATVDSAGRVRAVTNGTAVIHAELDSLSGAATVRVRQVPNRLIFAKQPASLFVASVFEVRVEVVDGLGTPVAGSASEVSVTLDANPYGATLAGTTKGTTATGVISFGDLNVAGGGRDLILRASTGSLPPVPSQTFDALSRLPAVTLRLVERGVTIYGIGSTHDVRPVAEDVNGIPALPPQLTWSSRNADIATVLATDSRTGRITARRDGQVSIAVGGGGMTDELLTTVFIAGRAEAVTWDWGDEDTNGLIDLWATSPYDAWAVGYGGVIRHYDGSRWTSVTPRTTTDDLVGVWASGPKDVWMVGRDGGLLRFDGGTWTRVTPQTVGAFSLSSVWGTGPDDVWASGYSTAFREAVFHFDGTRWSNTFNGQLNTSMSRVWGFGRNDVWAIGGRGDLWRFDGTRCSEAGPPGIGLKVRDVFGSAPDDVWVVTDSAAWRYEGTAWVNRSQGLNFSSGFSAGWSASSTSAWLSGNNQRQAYHFDGGGTWRAIPLPLSGGTLAVHGTGRGDVWVVGYYGEIAHYDGIGWASQDRRLTFDSPSGVWGSAADDIWAVGNQGGILHFDGGSWRVVGRISGVDLRAMWGSSDRDIWAVGRSGAVVHYDGTSWTRRTTPISGPLNEVWGSRPDDVWAVSDDGQIIRWDGSTWSSVPVPVPVTSLRGVWGMSDSDVWFAGANGGVGIVLHYDGTSLTNRSPPSSSPPLNAIWATAPDNVWAGGDHDVILHYDGKAWLNTVAGLNGYYQAFWGTGPSDIWALGGVSGCCPRWSRTLVHYDGTSWTDMTPGTLTWNGILGLWGTRDGPLWGWGYVGTLLKGTRR